MNKVWFLIVAVSAGYLLVTEVLCFVGSGNYCTWEQFTSSENLTKAVYMLPVMIFVVYLIERSGGGTRDLKQQGKSFAEKLDDANTAAESAADKWKSEH
jgi:hypothetical protein